MILATIYKATFDDGEPIVHWRTKGSKNGVRLWQNEDGSYTEAGRNSKPGGRYNTDYDPKAAREAKRAAKEQASIDKTRQRNQSTNDKIAARIPYSRDDLSEYERAQELSLMNNQLKYLKDIKEYQKQNESSHFQQVAHELKKELKSTEIKFYAAVGLGALGIGAAYLIGSGAIDPSIIKTAKDIAGGNVSNLFNSAVDNSAAVTAGINNAATTAGKAVADTATTAGKAVADTASNAAKTGQSAIDRLKGALGSIGKGNALVVTDDPGRVTYDSNQWIADMKSAAANSAKTEPRTEAEWLSSYMPSVYGSESYQNAFGNLSAADQAKILADNRTEQHDIIGRIVRAEGSGNDATRLKQLQSMDRSALLNALNRANNAAF